MRRVVCAALAALAFGVVTGSAAQGAPQASGTSPALDTTVQAGHAAIAAQQQIDQLDDQTRALVERYRSALWQSQQLNVYAEQVEPLLATQEQQRSELQRQLQQLANGAPDLMPLLLRMVDSLQHFVALDLPFLVQERRERLAGLQRAMADPTVNQAEKCRRVLEAYRVEADYGRSFGAEHMDIKVEGAPKIVDVLRVGRVALLYLTPDGREAGGWDATAKQWRPFPGSYRNAIREGLRIARETTAAEILTLPVPVAAAPAADSHASRIDVLPGWLVALGSAAARLVPAAYAEEPANDTEALLRQIHAAAQEDAKANQERIERFTRNRGEQQAQLAEAEAQLKTAQAKAAAVRSRYEADQKAIADLKTQLQAQSGELGQVYAAVREAAAQFRTDVADSYITAQFPDRLKLLDALADPDTLPSPEQLGDFWYTLQQEITEEGKVARFEATVVGADGVPAKTTVTRVGPFIAFADDHYLVMQAGSGLQVPARQTLDTSLARRFEAAGNGWMPIAVDPARGGLLKLAAERPSLLERIEQGRAVGYTIIAIGLVGLSLALYQLAYLFVVGGRMSRQLQAIDMPSADNPLGRVLACLRDDTVDHEAEVLETRVAEAVLRETPKLERFQPFLRMVVAAGPLLGLLGTVTGMIVTFQVITEVGAGDPKVMAGGISQAMIATVLGLLIAIPVLFINSILQARSRVLVQILDEQSAGLLARRLEQQHARRLA